MPISKYSLNKFIVLFAIALNSVFSQNKVTPEQWQADFSFLLDQMPKVHKNPFHNTSKADFEAFVQDLNKRSEGFGDNKWLVELTRIIAMIGDGHTLVNFFARHSTGNESKPKVESTFYPVLLYLFPEGIYAVRAGSGYENITGMRLIKIGSADIEEAVKLMQPLLPGDNEYSKKYNLPYYLVNCKLLNGLGITKSDNAAEYTFVSSNGKEEKITIKAVQAAEAAHFLFGNNSGENLPLYLKNDEKNYWFEYIPESKALYIKYKQIQPDKDESMKKFCNRIDEFINANEVNKIIIDIRNNGGGNNFTSLPLVNYLSNNPKINQKGKLFTIIGRETFSAASYFATKMELNTSTIFAGEPTGGSPNHFGDSRPVFLPNSGLQVRLSSLYWQNSFSFDKRNTTFPQIPVEITAKDYFTGKDPVLDAVLACKIEPESKVSDVSALTGKYSYSPFQVMEISADGRIFIGESNVSGVESPFLNTLILNVNDNTHFTGVSGLSFIRTGEGLILRFNGEEITLPKYSGKVKLPAELLAEGKTSEAIELFRKVKKEIPDYSEISEGILNNLGYSLLGEKKTDAAIEIFKLNVEFNPYSSNVYDSLGEAFMIAGDKESAIKNYSRSLELDPGNENAKSMIEKLKK